MGQRTRPDSITPRPEPLTVTSQAAGGDVHLRVAGAVDVSNVDELKAAGSAAVESGSGRVVLDLTACTFIDSTGVGAVVDLHGRLAADGRALLILRGPRAVQRVFQLIGLADVLPFADAA